jgi:hypothetical protein
MKTKNNNRRASKMATALCVAVAFGTSVWAQSDAGSDNSSTDEVYNRLEALMGVTETTIKYVAPSVEDFETMEAFERLDLLANNTEKAIRYEAPSVERAEFNEAFERLEMLASQIDNQIRYRIPEEGQDNTFEYAVQEDDQESKTNALALKVATVGK